MSGARRTSSRKTARHTSHTAMMTTQNMALALRPLSQARPCPFGSILLSAPLFIGVVLRHAVPYPASVTEIARVEESRRTVQVRITPGDCSPPGCLHSTRARRDLFILRYTDGGRPTPGRPSGHAAASTAPIKARRHAHASRQGSVPHSPRICRLPPSSGLQRGGRIRVMLPRISSYPLFRFTAQRLISSHGNGLT